MKEGKKAAVRSPTVEGLVTVRRAKVVDHERFLVEDQLYQQVADEIAEGKGGFGRASPETLQRWKEAMVERQRATLIARAVVDVESRAAIDTRITPKSPDP